MLAKGLINLTNIIPNQKKGNISKKKKFTY
jgi:hypothetical protein